MVRSVSVPHELNPVPPFATQAGKMALSNLGLSVLCAVP